MATAISCTLYIIIVPGRLVIFWSFKGGGWVERRCWVDFQCRGVLLIWMKVGQGPIALAVGAGGVVWTFFVSSIFFISPSLWETARYRLKYCLKGPLNPKQPTNQPNGPLRSLSQFEPVCQFENRVPPTLMLGV